jgi:hypothetical protein
LRTNFRSLDVVKSLKVLTERGDWQKVDLQFLSKSTLKSKIVKCSLLRFLLLKSNDLTIAGEEINMLTIEPKVRGRPGNHFKLVNRLLSFDERHIQRPHFIGRFSTKALVGSHLRYHQQSNT